MKLIDSLSVINAQEWKSLRKFVLMEIRSSSEANLLFEQLFIKKKNLEKKGLINKIKEEHFKDISHKSYLNLFSILYQIFENWIVFYDVKTNPSKYRHVLIKGLNDRGLYESANKVFDNSYSVIKSKTDHSRDNQLCLSQILYEQYYSNNPIKYRRKELLGELIDAFIVSNTTIYSLLFVESHNWANIKKLDFTERQSYLKAAIVALPNSDLSTDLELLEKLWVEDDLDALFEMANYVLSGKYGYSGLLVQCFGIYSIAKVIRQIGKGKKGLRQLLLDLYNFAFEHGLLTDRKAMSARRFMTTVHNLSVLLPKNDIYPFVEKWYRDVPYRDAASLYRLCEMIIAFQQKRFEDLLDLQRENLKLATDEQARFLVLRLVALYENRPSTYEQLVMEIQSVKRFLKRSANKTSNNFHSNVKNLVYFIEELNNYRFSRTKPTLTQGKTMLHRSWAVEKMTELK